MRWTALFLILVGTLALAPPRVSGETAGSFKAVTGGVLPLPPEDEPADTAPSEQTEQTSGDNGRTGGTAAEKPVAPTEPAPAEQSQSATGDNIQAAKDTGDKPVSPAEQTPSQPATGDNVQAGKAAGEKPAYTAGTSPTGKTAPSQTDSRPTPAETMKSAPFTVDQEETGITSQVPARSAPIERSWWSKLLFKIGLGDDPQPGETVQTPAEITGPADYIIGPGDQIGISVWRDDNLSRTVVVLPDGKISFPLLGELVAGGKTVGQLKQELEGKLSRYIADTGVTVEVKQSNSMIIYVVGRVNAPGRQILLANTNVLQALAMVGGPNPFADKGNIKIFRKDAGRTIMFPFNYDDVSEGRHLETNIELRRGDVIIVP